MRRRRLLVVPAVVVLACIVALVVWPRLPAEVRTALGLGQKPLWSISDRAIKASLIMRLPAAPQVVVLGGSRALRFQPAYIQRRTGETAFNAAVPHATPIDEWAYVNLFHTRFPHASFQFLWVIHVDEFDMFMAGPVLLEDPLLSQYIPSAFVTQRLDQFGRAATEMLQADAGRPHIIAPDGFMIWDSISAAAHNGSTFARRVAQTARAYRYFYSKAPAKLDPLAQEYFVKTLGLMSDLGATPMIVLAPLQPTLYRSVYSHGWESRHVLVLQYLHQLQRHFRFRLLDFSRLASVGGSPRGYYDGIHMKPATTRKVVDGVLKRFPHAFAPSHVPVKL